MSMFGPPKPVYEIMFNKDKSGSISTKEFGRLCFSLGYALTDAELELAIKLLDKDASGDIELSEFKEWWRRDDRWQSIQLEGFELQKRQDAASSFNQFDEDKSGSIDEKDFPAFYNACREKGLTNHSQEKFLENLDISSDRKVQFHEFINYLQNTGAICVPLPKA